jgi:hypothetical protein
VIEVLSISAEREMHVGLPVLQSVTVTVVVVTAGAERHAVGVGVSACVRALINCTYIRWQRIRCRRRFH